jgi:hypothetical protein
MCSPSYGSAAVSRPLPWAVKTGRPAAHKRGLATVALSNSRPCQFATQRYQLIADRNQKRSGFRSRFDNGGVSSYPALIDYAAAIQLEPVAGRRSFAIKADSQRLFTNHGQYRHNDYRK